MLFYRRVNKRAAIYCQFMPWQVVMEAVRSRLAWAAAAAAADAMEEEDDDRLGDRNDGTAGTGARRVSHPHDLL